MNISVAFFVLPVDILFVCVCVLWIPFAISNYELSFRIYTAIENSLMYYLTALVVQIIVSIFTI